MSDYERYLKTAERWNEKQAERNPLFAAAGLLEQVAVVKRPEDYLASNARYHQGHEDLARRHRRVARLYRLLLKHRIGQEHLQDLEDRWHGRIGPKSPEYEADFFYQALRRSWTDEEREHYEPWRKFDRELARRYSQAATTDPLIPASGTSSPTATPTRTKGAATSGGSSPPEHSRSTTRRYATPIAAATPTSSPRRYSR